jgi:hypothetical protein
VSIFVHRLAEADEPRPLGVSLVRMSDRFVWDAAAMAWVATPAAGQGVVPLLWMDGPDYDGFAMALIAGPTVAEAGEVAVVFHERADGGPVMGDPGLVYPSDAPRSVSVAFAFAR